MIARSRRVRIWKIVLGRTGAKATWSLSRPREFGGASGSLSWRRSTAVITVCKASALWRLTCRCHKEPSNEHVRTGREGHSLSRPEVLQACADGHTRLVAASCMSGGFKESCIVAEIRCDRQLRAEGASKLGGGICLRVAYRAARRGVVRSPFFAVVGLMGLSRRIAAPEAGHLGPDQAGIACIRVGMPIREASCHRLISDIHADRSD